MRPELPTGTVTFLFTDTEASTRPLNVRMGLHTGTPTVTTEGYVGVDVHRRARVSDSPMEGRF